jgi:hypothetical protein
MASEHRNILRWSIEAMRGPQSVMRLEVPWAYFTTQGISPCRDIDYLQGNRSQEHTVPRRLFLSLEPEWATPLRT